MSRGFNAVVGAAWPPILESDLGWADDVLLTMMHLPKGMLHPVCTGITVQRPRAA